MQEKRHVATDRARSRNGRRIVDTHAPHVAQTRDGRRRIGRPAAEPRLVRNALFDDDLDRFVLGATELFSERGSGAVRDVALRIDVGRLDAVLAGADDRDAKPASRLCRNRSHIDSIVHHHRMHDVRDLVIAGIELVADTEEQVYLRRRDDLAHAGTREHRVRKRIFARDGHHIDEFAVFRLRH